MKRREFIRNISAAAAAPLMLNGVPLQSFAAGPLEHMLKGSKNDKVLVLIQLHGGNDGLNTLIPVGKYTEYYDLRANIAIPNYGNRKYLVLDPSAPAAEQAGLHPDMFSSKEMFDQGRMAVVQAVGYENMNMSHFRGRDIMFMGVSYNEVRNSAWMGRFLEEEYPGYPDGYPNEEMADPLGLELGSAVSLAFQRSVGIPAGISLNNPDAFYDLIESVGVNPPTEPSFPNNFYGEELKYLMQFELKTNEYAERLKTTYMAGKNAEGVDYPSSYPLLTPAPYVRNPLSEQLKIIARLLSGGSKTRIFLARIGGFDTHAQQVDENDSSMGRHAALLYHLSTAIKAFHDDLKAQGLEERVLTMTFSEFGRRTASNGSYGTDHGRAMPVFLFGPGVKKKVHGPNPDLSTSNLSHLFDYREVFGRVLVDWLGSPVESVVDSGFGDYLDTRLDLFTAATSIDAIELQRARTTLDDCWPNPTRGPVSFRFDTDKGQELQLAVYNSAGQLVRMVAKHPFAPGTHQLDTDLSGLAAGNYIYRLQVGREQLSKILILQE